jgi:FkbM family methyltransferase
MESPRLHVLDVLDSYPLDKLARFDIVKVLDIGANAGLFAQYAKRILRPEKIICFEPEGGNFLCLKKNTRGCGIIDIYEAAVIDRNGWCSIENPGHDPNWLSVTWMVNDEEGPVKAVDIRSIIEEHGPIDLLKMDCEGSEWRILPAMKGLEAQVRFMMVEWHKTTKEQTASNFSNLLEDTFPSWSWKMKPYKPHCGMFYMLDPNPGIVSLD